MEEISLADALLFAMLFGIANGIADWLLNKFTKEDDDSGDRTVAAFEKLAEHAEKQTDQAEKQVDRLNEIASQLHNVALVLNSQNEETEGEE